MKKWHIVIFAAVFLSGCGINNNQAQEKPNQNLVRVKNSTIQEVDRTTGQEISKHLVELASSIPNVNDATAIVLGKYAIVGIDVNKNLERSEVGTIKYSVAESLKNDPNGARAVIIADPDLNARLREISEDIQAGRPIQGIMNELADISGRLMPEIPADIIEPKPKKATEDPKKQLNQKEEEKLENKQDKQSNYHKDN
ncbi:YhcN/YlaJ family sporulation lipoprotein [Cytobacillus sp. FJAT-53684]|uniref:YhcN/YlaJ family sporulation lipoprotein n=1 Tax=Cytobacillus mangrovibacter TaxID=3299024 RepID=A0ABW6JW60_9BACI